MQQQIQEGKFRQRTKHGALRYFLDIANQAIRICQRYPCGYFSVCALGGCPLTDFWGISANCRQAAILIVAQYFWFMFAVTAGLVVLSALTNDTENQQRAVSGIDRSLDEIGPAYGEQLMENRRKARTERRQKVSSSV